MENSIQKAANNVGGHSALARKLGLSPQAVQQWCASGRVPAERVIDVERITSVSRHELRPDIYPTEPAITKQ